MNKAIFIGLEAMPLNKDIVSSHRESQSGFEVLPDAASQHWAATILSEQGFIPKVVQMKVGRRTRQTVVAKPQM